MSDKKLVWRLLVAGSFWVVVIGFITWVFRIAQRTNNFGLRVIASIFLSLCMWLVIMTIFWFIKGFWDEWKRLRKNE